MSDSGISLVDPSDSGLSLERGDLQLGKSKVESLDLGGDDLIALDDDQDLSETPTQLKADDDFLLTPAEEGPVEESSGSQVIALDSEFDLDESAKTMIGAGPGVTALDDDEDDLEEPVELSDGALSSGGLSSGELGGLGRPCPRRPRWLPTPTMGGR